jgi:predicted O-methyltransferase YrrM
MVRSLAQQLLDQIYQRRAVETRDGQHQKLHSEITPDEGELIQSVIRQHNLKRSLEIGCAFGLSSLYICDAIRTQAVQPHLILDPFQSTEWQNIGLTNLQRAEITNFELREEFSEFALPRLLQENRRFDFVLIDGYHTFDQTMIDFYFVDRLLEVGGVCLLDDLQLPGVRQAARYIAKLPNYKAIKGARVRVTPPSLPRWLVEASLRMVARVLPSGFRGITFADALFTSDIQLGLQYEMVAFQKTGPDQRTSHWYKPF